MLRQFLDFIDSHRLCDSGDRILVACSGGIDSMVLARLFRSAGFNFEVAHLNFQLRGEESDGDEAFVQQHDERWGCEVHTMRVDTKKYAEERGCSVQMAARELRYEWFARLTGERSLTKVATAHHQGDFAETVIMNMLKGHRDPAGIPIVNHKIIRPLLFASRAQINQYAAENGIIWREDASNHSTDYTRNKIRHELIPTLKSIHPNLEASLFDRSFIAADAVREAQRQFQEWKARFVTSSVDRIEVRKEGLREAKAPTFLHWLTRPLGFHFDQCTQMMESLWEPSGKIFHSTTHSLVLDRHYVIIERTRAASLPVQLHLSRSRACMENECMEWHFRTDTTFSSDPTVACLDGDLLEFPLTWRTWQAGDVFQPLGMEGEKKLSDFLIDRKVSVLDKERVTVVESRGQIIWVVGHRIDHRFRVTGQTRRQLVLRWVQGAR